MELPALALSVAIGLMMLLLSSTTEAKKVRAIYVFGDSTADVGNNNHLAVDEGTRANFPHNGIDYPGGEPTGRFSNGYNSVDYLAMMMGFKESPPAYFSDDQQAKLERGVNFASGGSGVLDTTGQNRSFSMNMQIMFFQKEVDRLVQSKGKGGANLFLSKSIFIFSVVSNDLFAFYQNFGFQNSTQNSQFISSITTQFKLQLKRIYDLGARKFAVFGTGLLGCPPALKQFNPGYACVDDLNALSQLFNEAMRKEVQSLSSTYEGMKYSFINSYNVYLTVMANPERYGFKVVDAACCGSGVLNAETVCLPNVTYCSNRKEYLSWDYVHPTQAAYEVTAKYAFGGSSKFTTPINIGKLIDIASESAFSAGKRVNSDQKSRLSDESVEASICLKDWYNAGDRATTLKISTDQNSSDELTITLEAED